MYVLTCINHFNRYPRQIAVNLFLNIFGKRHRGQWLGLISGLVVFGVISLFASTPDQRVLAIALLMVIWWISEAIPLAATALVPILVFPVIGVLPLVDIALLYMHPLIFLFLGGFLVAKALECWELHSLVAKYAFQLGAKSDAGLVGSMMVATAFLSMWISNTTAAIVMAPIAKSIVSSYREVSRSGHEEKRFGACMMLGVAFSATIGGMATVIGTPPNALLVAYLQSSHDITIGFGQWMLIGVPVMLILLPITWLILTRISPCLKQGGETPLEVILKSSPTADAGLPPGAKLTAAIVVLFGLILVFRPVLETVFAPLPLGDAGILMTAALVLFAIPAPSAKRKMLLDWKDARKIRWDVLILFGGGLALASAIDSSGLSNAVGYLVADLEFLPVFLLILLCMVVVVLLGELASNTAMAAVFLPVAATIAVTFGLPATDLLLPVGLAASLGFMLPVATPPNAIVYGTGEVSSGQMFRTGAIVDITTVIVVFLLVRTLGPWLLPV